MGEPITKKELSRYVAMKMENEHQLEKLARMKSSEQLPGMKPSDGSKKSAFAGDRMAAAIIRRMEQEPKIIATISANLEEMERIEAAINSLQDPQERTVLRVRYLDGVVDEETGVTIWRLNPWPEVARVLYGSNEEKYLKMTYRLHGRALQSVKNATT